MSIEKLSKLVPGTPGMLAGAGGIPALTASDIAAALALGGVDQRGELALRAKWLGEEDAARQLKVHVFTATVEDVTGCMVPKRGAPSLVWDLAEFVTREFIDPNTCPKCNGTRFVGNKPCPSCTETPGKRYAKPSRICHAIGLHHSCWGTGVQDAHIRMHRALNGWEQTAVSGLKLGVD